MDFCQSLGWGNGERLKKGYKLLVIQLIRSEDLMYKMVSIDDNAVLYT